MIIISHRGNLDGPDKERENNPYFIDDCITKGFDVEIDLRTLNGELFLGHDVPEYKTNIEWLLERKKNLWIHTKDYESLKTIIKYKENLKFFCHEGDRFTLTSNGYIWSHDLKNQMTNECIIPLIDLEQVNLYQQKGFYAVCTDYVFECQKKFL